MNKKDEIYKKVKKVLIKISIVIGISILILLFLAVPIIIFFLLKNGVEKGAEDSWAIGVGFYGALLGGLGTIIAFLVTSYQTNKIQKENIEQFSNDKRLAIKPYLDLTLYHKNINVIGIINKDNPITIIENLINPKILEYVLEINNLGLGPAIDVQITKMTLNNKDIILDSQNKWLNSINVNAEKKVGIYTLQANMLLKENQDLYGSKNELEKKFKSSKELYFKIEYGDILDNKYIKNVYLTITTDPTILHNNENLYEISNFIFSVQENKNKCYEKLIKRSI